MQILCSALKRLVFILSNFPLIHLTDPLNANFMILFLLFVGDVSVRAAALVPQIRLLLSDLLMSVSFIIMTSVCTGAVLV